MNIKKIIQVFSIVALIFFLVFLAYESYFKKLIPVTFTDFKSYKAFRKIAFDFFPDELPGSSNNIVYYYYRGYFDEIILVSFDIENNNEAEELIKNYKQWFKKYSDEYHKDNIKITDKIIKSEKLEYLENYIDRQNDNLLLYYVYYPGESDTRRGIIKDNNNHFVIFYEYDSKGGVH
ncbi:MAG: hypothetical protein J5517_08580 [Eubacterium sp.]|nr:hypothetical protein [Eubacterium sp.]